jgi:putative MFS transporter
MNNWVKQMNLYCTPSVDIGLLGSAFITGCFIGSFILPRCADIFGRRPIFIVGLLIQIFVVTACLFCKSLDLAYFLLFMGGVGETGRYYVAYVYAVEMMPSKVQNDAGLYIFLFFGLAMSYIALQFWFLTKEWQVNAGISLLLASLSLISTIAWLPESPRFLYS